MKVPELSMYCVVVPLPPRHENSWPSVGVTYDPTASDAMFTASPSTSVLTPPEAPLRAGVVPLERRGAAVAAAAMCLRAPAGGPRAGRIGCGARATCAQLRPDSGRPPSPTAKKRRGC